MRTVVLALSLFLAMPEASEMLAGIVRQHGGTDAVEVVKQPLPKPGPGEARVRIAFAGVNFIDIYLREGAYSSSPPYIPGLEGAGVVESTGPGAEVWLGRRVAFVHKGAGAYSEFAVVPVTRLVPLGNDVQLQDAAAVMLQGLTAQYLLDGTVRLERNDTVLVHAAAGGTGRLIVQVAKLRGLKVIATVSTKAKAAVATAAGADKVIVSDYSDFATEVLQHTQNRGVAAIFDGVGNRTFLQGFRCLRPRGGMVLFGASSGFPPSVDLSVLAGSKFLVRPSLFDFIAEESELRTRAAAIMDWLQAEQLNLQMTVLPLADAAEALRQLQSRESTGKLLLKVGPVEASAEL
ncbi:unnamed protein product [Durusdinium trenchii]|uniref:Enoyl reductase (ER) domain-containing protein n=4 Tax=Durusdinium trenchii TaxID=1381693 RepID=A0ABP0IZQ8_9DINO